MKVCGTRYSALSGALLIVLQVTSVLLHSSHQSVEKPESCNRHVIGVHELVLEDALIFQHWEAAVAVTE